MVKENEAPKPEAPKTVVEKIFRRFGEFAGPLLDEFGEARGLVLVVDWAVGQNDFPAGMLFTRNKRPTPAEFVDISGQLNKMIARLSALNQQDLGQLITTWDKLKKEIADLERRKAELTEPASGGGPAGPGNHE